MLHYCRCDVMLMLYVLAGILEREQEQSVVYGSVDFGKTVVTSEKYRELVRLILVFPCICFLYCAAIWLLLLFLPPMVFLANLFQWWGTGLVCFHFLYHLFFFLFLGFDHFIIVMEILICMIVVHSSELQYIHYRSVLLPLKISSATSGNIDIM